MVIHGLFLFKLRIETDPRNKLHTIPRFPAEPFAIHLGDYLRFTLFHFIASIILLLPYIVYLILRVTTKIHSDEGV